MATQIAAARMRAARAAEQERAAATVARVVGLSDLEALVRHVEALHPRGTGAVTSERLRLEIVAWATERFAPTARTS